MKLVEGVNVLEARLFVGDDVLQKTKSNFLMENYAMLMVLTPCLLANFTIFNFFVFSIILNLDALIKTKNNVILYNYNIRYIHSYSAHAEKYISYTI